MLVAVLTCTRDRLIYSQHCFETLRLNAGCEFHHYVLDQDSKDGTNTWLDREFHDGRIKFVHHAGQNIGIARGVNLLADKATRHGGYDAVVKFDNDCEMVQEGTLRRVATVAANQGAVISPIVDGLTNPPLQIGRTFPIPGTHETVREMKQVGGICLATPASFWTHFRFPEDLPVWGHDDAFLCQYAWNEEMLVGYLQSCRVNHFRSTEGQHQDFPSYFVRRQAEGGPS